ncbi:TonB-dependent receptor [Persicitalea jodogahamensis]|uniref:Membrane protein n=1 Tax=Persicitalea jodogahamensis TaxID=402147 RepID=A0A8J3D1Y6_9BACT|nr:TonB-dependent receptor [Persicitalea jodogahamensis]GHB55625.1 membrane protein [Persicitalea jodogahamensis]
MRDAHSGLPVVGATLLLVKSNQGVFTDAAGRYEFTGLCPGKYEIECRIIGYQSRRDTVNLTEGHEENFSLDEEEIHLKDVEITAHRTDAPISQPLTTLSGSDLARTRGQSLGESLQGITGVTMLQTGSSIAKPVIHGMHSNRVLIMNNGVRQEGQQWGSEHAPEIDPFVATRLSVVKGAAGVRYGSDAIGGVVLVEPEELPIDKPISGELNAAAFSNGRQGATSATLQGGVKGLNGFGWRAQGTLKRGGNIRTPTYFLDNTGSAERNFSLAAGYRKKGFGAEIYYSHFKTKIGIFSGSHIGSVTDLLNVIQSGEPLIKADFSYTINRPYQDVAHNLLKGEMHYHFSDGNRLKWVSAYQYDNRLEYDLHAPRNDSLATLNRAELSFRLTTLTNDIIWDHKPLAGKLSGQIGVSTLYQYNLMDGRPLIPNFDQWNIGIFGIERLVHNGWELEAGLRYDYRDLTTYRFVNRLKTTDHFVFHNASGTLGAGRNLNDRWSVRVNLGTAWRAPNVSELFSDGVHHGAAAYEQGDANLAPEKALNTIASIRYATDNLTLEVGGYYNYIRDYIYLKPQPEPILTVRGAFPYFKYNQTDATFKGVDLSADWKLSGHLSWISKLTYLRVNDVRNDAYLVMIPANRWENQLKYAWDSKGRWEKMFFALGNRWVGEQRRIPPGSDFAPPPSGYALWNAQLSGNLVFSEKKRVEVTLTVDNLLDTVYRDYLNRFRYYADDMGRNVSLRMRYVF